MPYPNHIQAVLLFDQSVDTIDAMISGFARIEEMKTGTIFNVPEHHPGVFARLQNAEQNLTLTYEYVNTAPEKGAFRGALKSPVSAITCPDIAERIARAGPHILLEVSHVDDAAFDDEETAADPDFSPLGQFQRRLELLALMARTAIDHAMPSAVHWTQSNRLFSGEDFETAAAGPIPGPLHIHPQIFSPKRQALDNSPPAQGLRTFGASHWLGREIAIQPCALSWADSYSAALEFITASINDAKFADGSTFTPNETGQNFRVSASSPEPSGSLDSVSNSNRKPCIELTALEPVAASQEAALPDLVPPASASPRPSHASGLAATRQTARKPMFGRKSV